jgi:hypothetical protein
MAMTDQATKQSNQVQSQVSLDIPRCRVDRGDTYCREEVWNGGQRKRGPWCSFVVG